ncbi:MAG: SDR family NAD(P)-dependent oxidoreductase [Alphaproteobacteria bacterium]|nr:SDR family NAD(P)-dependent oxidoreductase [Alphaproteobacteria bacterium]
MTEGKLQGRIALITGASRGIGAAVAKRYAAEGAHVILVARTQSALERVDDAIRAGGHEPATLVPMDITDYERIDELGGVIAQRFKKLDILVGNAGILGSLSPVAMSKPKMWQEVMDTNVMANYRLIRSFDPLLRASDAGRALFVTSGVTDGANAYWGAYAASKAALEMLVQTYAAEVTKTNMRVNLVDPGVVATAMRKEAFPGEDANLLTTAESITDRFVDLALDSNDAHGQKLAV